MKQYTNKDIVTLVDFNKHLDTCIKYAKEGKVNFWTISSEVRRAIDMLMQYNSLEMVKQDSKEFDADLTIQIYIDALDKLLELQDIAGTMIGDSDE